MRSSFQLVLSRIDFFYRPLLPPMPLSEPLSADRGRLAGYLRQIRGREGRRSRREGYCREAALRGPRFWGSRIEGHLAMSDGMESVEASTKAIERIVEEATEHAARADDAQAHAAFASWQEAMRHVGMVDDWATFSSEAAFSAVARAAQEARISNTELRLDVAFPHLYSSPFFGWYRLPVDGGVRDALAKASGADPAELLSWIYQFAIPSDTRKRFGNFYTPAPVVESMLDSVGFFGPAI